MTERKPSTPSTPQEKPGTTQPGQTPSTPQQNPAEKPVR